MHALHKLLPLLLLCSSCIDLPNLQAPTDVPPQPDMGRGADLGAPAADVGLEPAAGRILYTGDSATVEIGRTVAFTAFYEDPQGVRTPLGADEITLERMECQGGAIRCLTLDAATMTLGATAPGTATLVLKRAGLVHSVSLWAKAFELSSFELGPPLRHASKGDVLTATVFALSPHGWRRPVEETQASCTLDPEGLPFDLDARTLNTAKIPQGTHRFTQSCTLGTVTNTQTTHLVVHQATPIRAYDAHTCAKGQNGALFCWGSNAFGQLGHGSYGQKSAPVPVAFEGDVAHFDVGSKASCLVDDQGGLYAWGAYGEEGEVQGGPTPQKLNAPGESSLRFVECAIAGGGVCGLSDRGGLWCMHPKHSFLGTAGLPPEKWHTQGSAPRAVLTKLYKQQFLTLAGASHHMCGIDWTGNVLCWGTAHEKKQGKTVEPFAPDPVPVESASCESRHALPTATSWRALDAGIAHSCAITAQGQLHCWGENRAHLLRGNISDRNCSDFTPGTFANQPLQDLGTSALHTCVSTTGGNLYCWGREVHGALGLGADKPTASSPTLLSLSTTVAQVATGSDHTCVVEAKGPQSPSIRCWGSGAQGRTGAGGKEALPDLQTPSFSWPSDDPNALAYQPKQVSLGQVAGCARFEPQPPLKDPAHSVLCWGLNVSGIRGIHNTEPQIHQPPTALVTDSLNIASSGRPASLALSGDGACLLYPHRSGEMHLGCWGSRQKGQLQLQSFQGIESPPKHLGDRDDMVEMQAGNAFMCGRFLDGRVACWGDNSVHQLGHQEPDLRLKSKECEEKACHIPLPVNLPWIPGASDLRLKVGGQGTCAWKPGTTEAACWGAFNALRTQVYVDTYPTYVLPAPKLFDFDPSGQTRILDLAIGERHVCAILAPQGAPSGTIHCVGQNAWGQLGVPGGYAVLPDEQNGGLSATTPLLDPDAAPNTPLRATRIEAAGSHTCSALEEGDRLTLHCWGANDQNQVGLSHMEGAEAITWQASSPAIVSAPHNVFSLPQAKLLDLALSPQNTCVIVQRNATSSVHCWGDNATGKARWDGALGSWNALADPLKSEPVRLVP